MHTLLHNKPKSQYLVQVLFLILFLSVCSYYKWFRHKEPHAIVLVFKEDGHAKLIANFDYYKKISPIREFNLTDTQGRSMNLLNESIQHSIAEKDSLASFQIHLGNCAYGQFIGILDICLKNNIHALLYNGQKNIVFIFPNYTEDIRGLLFLGDPVEINPDSTNTLEFF